MTPKEQAMKPTKITVEVPEFVHDKAVRSAKLDGKNLGPWVVELIERGISRHTQYFREADVLSDRLLSNFEQQSKYVSNTE